LDTAEELIEVDIEVGKQDGQRRQRGHGATVLDGAHQRSRERRRDRGLAQARFESTSSELPADHAVQLARSK
jgi:hypothetical protein